MTNLNAGNTLRAGAAQVDITPWAGAHLSGDIARRRPAQLVLDPLYAKALVVEHGGRKLCVLALDVTIITADYAARLREGAASLGIEPDAMMVHAIQTHTAPSLGYFMLDPDFPAVPDEFEWLRGSERAYADIAAERALEAVRKANDRLEPVELGLGSAIEGRVAFNRRAVTRQGGILMPGPAWAGGELGPTDILYIEGPMDPEVGVICFRTPDMRIPALIANYACHPVNVFPRPLVTPDWPGALSAELQAAYGGDCVPVVLNGACGNINPWPPFDPDYVPDHRRMGRVLAERAEATVRSLRFAGDAVLDWRVRHVPIPLREVPPDELAWAKSVLGDNPRPEWADAERTHVDFDWMVAASIVSSHLQAQREGSLDYEVQVLRIGRASIVGLPGEPFVEGGLEIKLRSPTRWTHIAHCTTQYVGYLPTPEALTRGGHEASTRYWAKLIPQALPMAVDAAVVALHEMFG